MGVSFKVARMGTRYRPKSLVIEDNNGDDNVLFESHQRANELFNNIPEQLYPYDRESETLISAIEYGWLPGDTLDNLPFKYVNGSILCQIRDYRNCLFHEGGIRSSQNNPIVHRVILQMCMENVVKDIMSISDDSWTYKNLLDFESHVLKALQPDLFLNPLPFPYKHCREPLAKKVNLEIAWSWKRREQHNARASNQVFSYSSHVTEVPDNSARQNPNFQTSLVHQDRGVMWAKENIPTSVLIQESDLLQETNSDSYLLTSQPSYQYQENRDLSALQELPTPNVFAFERSSSKSTSELTPSLSNRGVKGRCRKQAIQSSKKQKKQTVHCSFQQLPEKTIEISAPLQLQWKDTSSHQHVEAGRDLQEIFQGKACHSQFIKNGQHANHEDTPRNSQAGSATSTVKLEPAEACYPSPELWRIKDNCVGKDKRIRQSDGLQSQNKQSSHLIKTNNPLLDTSRNATSKRKSLENPQLTYDGGALASSQNVDSLQAEASAPSRWKTNPPKGFSGNVVDSSVNMSNANMADAKSLLEGNHLVSQSLEIKSDPVLERLRKIGGVTQRYELSKKRKLDQNLERKPFSDAIPMIAFHLSNCEDGIRSEETAKDKVSLSKHSMGRDNVSNSRTLLFIRNSSPCYQGDDRVDQVRFVLKQKLNKDTVEANIVYGCEDETNSIVFNILPAFPNVQTADLFASQFTSVMAREGYDLYSDIVGPMAANTGCSSKGQQPSNTVHQSDVIFGLPSSSSNPGLTHYMPSPMPANMSAHNSWQLPLKKTSPAAQLLLPGNIQSSSLEFTSNCPPDSNLDIASQFSSMPLQMHEIMRGRAHIQPQVQQLVAHQEQVRLRKAMLGGSGTSYGGSGTLQRGNGVQGLGNFWLASSDNLTGNGMASRPRVLGGRMPSTGNIGPENNRCSILGINDGKQLIGSTSDYMAATSLKPGTAEGQWRGSVSRILIQRSDLLAPMNNMPEAPEKPCSLSSQQQQLLQMYQAQQEMKWSHQCMLLQQQDMGLSVQNRGLINLAKQVGSSSGQVSPQRYARWLQINHQEPNPGSVGRDGE
ncbi:hypothetical protein L484_025842 [Morus notabilis]|uniref:Uncharacterized protein n=1 Tax=Morus notabilis TaxID=981085 RepID=W9R2F7_9ROSA|nr:hypothetical protein L484_025842 [Morus notabilis]